MGDTLIIDGPGGALSIKVLQLSHGPTPSLGFIFDERLGYAPDVWDIPSNSLTELYDIDTFIVDALRYNDHPTHANADKSLSWLAKIRARRGILTNLHIDMDYKSLSQELPPCAEPAYDGLEVFV